MELRACHKLVIRLQSTYVTERDSLNINKLPVGVLDTWPIVPPVRAIPERLSPFTDKPDGGAWSHFFTDDYRFQRAWNQPARYIGILRRFAGTLSPDFSLFIDDPAPAQRWNDYRNKWLAAFCTITVSRLFRR